MTTRLPRDMPEAGAWVCRGRSNRVKAVGSVLAALLVAITGFGRMWVGAHWPSDVLGAVLWSLPVVLLMTWAGPAIEKRMPDRKYRWTK